MKTMKAAEIVLDFDLYPRNNIDTGNVRGISDAMKAGITLPPVLIDKLSKRCVDGFHRVKAKLREDKNGILDVIEKKYANEKDMFLDAMRYNSSHGARLDMCDRTRCTIIAERLSIPINIVAGALHMPIDKLGELKNTRTATNNRLTIPLKHTVSRGFHGKTLTDRQVQANEKLSGMNQIFYANQLIELIESEMLDVDDENLMTVLKKLNDLLKTVLS
jgi:hypothetical protein